MSDSKQNQFNQPNANQGGREDKDQREAPGKQGGLGGQQDGQKGNQQDGQQGGPNRDNQQNQNR